MKVQVQELSPIERKLSIEVESARVADELTRAYAQLGRQVKIAGFRPGKIPRRILEQRFKDQVEDDVVRRVVERAYLEAIREHNVEVVSSPQVTNATLKPNAPFTFEARVEVKPKIEVKDYLDLPLTKPNIAVEDAQVSEQIERLRQNMSRLEPVERDTAQAGDFAMIDYVATSDGKPFAGSQAENVTVEVAPGELVESKIAALEGVKKGEVKEVDYAFPGDYRVEEVQGKVARFKLTLKGLKVKVVPELNDELAKELQAGETLDELKQKVRKDLERAAQRKAEGDSREALIQALVERNPLEVPKAMVDRAVDAMLEGALRAMAGSGVDLRQLNMNFDSLREEMRPRGLSEVKGTLLFEAVAEKEGITATDEDVEKKIEQLAEESGEGLAQVKKHFKAPERRQNLKLRLREEKTVEFLKARAKYS